MRCQDEKGNRVISVATTMLFDWYTHWVKTSGRQCVRNSRSCFKELADIGLVKDRIMVGGTRYTVIHLSLDAVVNGIASHLDIPCELIELDWHHLNMDEDRWKSLCDGNFWEL